MPWYLLFDYVEVFTYDEANNEYHLHWRDDFETFNTDRWYKADGGFDSNSSVFHPENVSVKSGNLVLKMEPAAAAAAHHQSVLDLKSVDVEEDDVGDHRRRQHAAAGHHH